MSTSSRQAASPSPRIDSLGSKIESVGSVPPLGTGAGKEDERGGEGAKTLNLSERRAATRDRLLDACAEIIATKGFESVSMTGVASHAGITRQTVYRYFPNARDIIHATFIREGAKVMSRQVAIFESDAEPGVIFLDCVVETLRSMLSSEVFRKTWGKSRFPTSMLVSTFDERFTEPAVAGMAHVGDRLGWSRDDCREVYAVIARTVISFLTIPPPEGFTEEGEIKLRSYLERRLLPSLGISAP